MNQPSPLFNGGILGVVLLLFVTFAAPETTRAYVINHWVFDAAGGFSSSTHYRNLSVVSQPTPLGTAASSGYRNYPGFLPSVAAEGHLLPDYVLFLTVAGSGTGRVTSSPAGIQCNVDCSASFNAFFSITLTPTPDPYMVFMGWSGSGCSGTTPCTLELTGPATVTATFDRDTSHAVYLPGVTPGTGTYYTTLQSAYDAAAPGETIAAWATGYPEDLNCNQPKHVILEGGYDQAYASQVGYTTLIGTLIISKGTVVVDRLAIQ